MKKIRCFLATIALVVTLSGLSLQGMGVGSLANAASSWHTSTASAQLVAGQAMAPLHFKPAGPCLGGGTNDC